MNNLALSLVQEFGSGFVLRNLFNMMRLAEAFPDREIVQTLPAQLSWSHFVELLAIDEPLRREFYAELTRLHRWSVRTLSDKIHGMLFEGSLLSRKPDALIEQEITCSQSASIAAFIWGNSCDGTNPANASNEFPLTCFSRSGIHDRCISIDGLLNRPNDLRAILLRSGM